MRCYSGSPTRLQYAKPEQGEVSTLALAFTTSAQSQSRWTLRVQAVLLNQGTTRDLGTVETVEANLAGPSPIVAIACCPGAWSWIVEVNHLQGATPDECDVELIGYPDLTTPGLIPMEPWARLFGERYTILAAALPAGATAVPIPPNQRIQTVAAWQDGTGGAFAIASIAGQTVVLPPSGAARIEPHGSLRGTDTVNFTGFPAGGGGYIIELTT